MSVNLASGLSAGIQALGLDMSDDRQKLLLDYVASIQKWNKVYNLTALRDPADMLSHHLLDSLTAVAPLARHTQGQAIRVLDVACPAWCLTPRPKAVRPMSILRKSWCGARPRSDWPHASPHQHDGFGPIPDFCRRFGAACNGVDFAGLARQWP